MPANVSRCPAGLRRPRRNPLALCLVPLCAFASVSAIAQSTNIWTIDSCDDASSGDIVLHSGTLRFAAAHAASGDTIDMTGLACSTISLATGAITFNQNDITLAGPAAGSLTISGKQNLPSALIAHNGSGTLTLKNLEFYYANNNSVGGYVHGGCVYSYADIVLDHVKATHCNATVSGGGSVIGGAVFARNDMTMKFSTIAFNQAHGTAGARAGGAYAKNHLRIEYSTIDHNTVYSSDALFGGGGGGVFAKGLLLKNSTVSNNHSHGDGGGFAVVQGVGGDYLKMYSSTVSGNSADRWVGGGYVSAPLAVIYNSTIAFNDAAAGNRFFAAGLALSTYFTPMTATLQSSLFSNNKLATVTPVDNYGITEYDLGTALGGSIAQPNTVTFNTAPANNLIRSTFAAGLPSDTVHDSCPALGPLRDNGGPTWTHALLSGSAAIDAGNNVLGAAQDQRGVSGDPGPPYAYARESNSVADIGAYEVQQVDRIFATSGEACVLQPPGA